MPYLFEPYNAYQKPPKKKHWMEIAEEEALLHRVQLEEQARQKDMFQEALKQHLALREANAKANQTNLNNQNVALPQYTPQPASQQIQDGQYAAPAGGGGWVLPSELESQEVARFSAVPSTGVGPLTVTFTNLTVSPQNDTFLWNLGSGSYTSSAAITPPALTYTQTGSYTVTLQETSSTGNKSVTTQTITVTDPTLNAWINSPLLATGIAPLSRSFTVTRTYNGNGAVTGYLHFGDGKPSVAFVNNGTIGHVYNSGSFTASLALTESSYGHTNVATVYISASWPTLTPLFTVTTSSNIAPSIATFANTSTQVVGNDDLYNYTWYYGDGSPTDTGFQPPHTYQTGSFIVKLAMTESYYGVSASYTIPGGITSSAPTLQVAFTTQSVGFGGALDSYMEPVTNSYTRSISYNGHGTLTYDWEFGNGESGSGAGPFGNVYYGVGGYTASLSITESSYNSTGYYTQSFIVST